ncbi:RNA polymerase III subunit C82 [Didymosphaeria variabile]|uniref:RNA polymerase III subunit C82 n=1 Tax=Didymosphaeria variabile TaxID=1932322 RepID=A0A9W8XF54_9PLEO|nr:RNA polymerase III subunit C82 [Didymosphaeria variabile]KAJ4348737.1 RNA polymerase III subunit C82 [Didymosphaeria variabile]
MAPVIETRRSARLAVKPETHIDPKTHARTPIQKKRTSPRNATTKKKSKPLSIDLEQIEELLAASKKKPQRPRVATNIKKDQRATPPVIEDATTEDSDDYMETDSEGSDSEDEFSMEDDSAESEDEYHEKANMSHDHIVYLNSHDLRNDPGHRYSTSSYDSRLEPGNEQYERDDFLVDDDESVEMEDSDVSDEESDADVDDLVINMERDPVRVSYRTTNGRVSVSSLFSDADNSHRSNSAVSPKTVRVVHRASQDSYSHRRSDSLFVTDLVGDPSITHQLAPWLQTSEKEVETPFIARASEDVVEEIVDSLALFSRRVNRDRPPIRLRLAAAVLEDLEIRYLLEDAIHMGLGRKRSLADGSKRLSIGPKGR